jgi:putative aldouronate transport system substrate-binding protein
MKGNKSIALVLAALMTTATLAACGGNTNPSSASKPTSETVASTASTSSSAASAKDDRLPAVGDFTKKLKLTWYMCSDATAYKEENNVAKALNERFNVEITTLKINGFDNDKMNVTLASGDIPDVLIRWGGQDYYRDGLVQAITKEMIARYMPKTNKVLDTIGDSSYMYATNTAGDKIIGVPQISVNGDMVSSMAIRKDWLDTVGAAVPTTISELTEVLRKFTFNDPDGNGKKDTYGISAPGLHNNLLYASFPTIFGAFGTIPTYWTKTARYPTALSRLPTRML